MLGGFVGRSDTMEIGAHILVSGMVQAVGFRYFAYQWAGKLGLKGFVRNLYEGSVELEVEGDRSLIEEFIVQLKVGPRAARVSNVRVVWNQKDKNYQHFEMH